MYLHHVPGRLRIRVPHLKRNHAQAHEARRAASEITGVESVHVNVVTGSLTILYDPGVVTANAVIAALRDAGHIASRVLLSDRIASESWPISRGSVGISIDRVSKAIATAAMEKLLERSAAALINALI